jgi:enoyl-CoA hydratase
MALIVEQDGPVTTIVLNRPHVRNAVDHATALELSEAFDAFERDPNASVAVLCGTGETFCAGYDLKTVSEGALKELYEPEGDGPLGPSRRFIAKPTIAAVNGYAVAGGLELALLCDLRVVEEDATFGVFCRRWGVPLCDGGTVRLPRLIGMGRALDLILTGRPVGADEALAMGLANRVVANGEARAAAQRLAHEIARFPQICVRTDRQSTYEQWNLSLEQALKNEGRLGAAPIMNEAATGAARFAGGVGRGGSFADV